MTYDADIMLTDDVLVELGQYMLRADIVTFFEWSSQVLT